MNLSYDDNLFDVVLTSETLEHIPDWRKATQEIHRVLKLGGKHIFTIPIILSRKTRTRARLQNDKLVDILPPSFHGCDINNPSDYKVITEFGGDFMMALDEAGFRTEIYFRNILHISDPNLVLVSTKV